MMFAKLLGSPVKAEIVRPGKLCVVESLAFGCCHCSPQSVPIGSLLGLPYRILYMNHKGAYG